MRVSKSEESGTEKSGGLEIRQRGVGAINAEGNAAAITLRFITFQNDIRLYMGRLRILGIMRRSSNIFRSGSQCCLDEETIPKVVRALDMVYRMLHIRFYKNHK